MVDLANNTTVATKVPPLQETSTETIIRLAYEGVPVCVIARATKLPSSDIQEIVEDALADGTLARKPLMDWPPGMWPLSIGSVQREKDKTPPIFALARIDEAELVTECMQRFKLSKLQSAIFTKLLRTNGQVSKDALHHVTEELRNNRATRPANMEETNIKMVDVVICHIRKRLKHFGVKVETVWGHGYYISKEDKEHVHELITS